MLFFNKPEVSEFILSPNFFNVEARQSSLDLINAVNLELERAYRNGTFTKLPPTAKIHTVSSNSLTFIYRKVYSGNMITVQFPRYFNEKLTELLPKGYKVRLEFNNCIAYISVNDHKVVQKSLSIS